MKKGQLVASSEYGAWSESGWPVDQVMMGLAFFSSSRSKSFA